jgi:hypothetical protein
MSRSLLALAALPLLVNACASSDTTDELAGETSADEALDGKADGGAPDGTYTYFEIWRDQRKCASPACGGFFLWRLNRSTTTCHDGSSDFTCYVPELDWSEANLPEDLQQTLLDAAGRDALSDGAVAIVRGRFGAKQYDSFGNLGRFIVTEAWVSANDAVSDGVFVKALDNGVRCITSPCSSITEKALNTSRSANIAGIDWSVGGFSDDQVAGFGTDLTKPHGVIVAGNRYSWSEHSQTAKGRTATAVFEQLVSPQCYVGGCSSQICSDHPGAISTCEWKDEYACYQTATCERQADGNCGWTQTAELDACLAQP